MTCRRAEQAAVPAAAASEAALGHVAISLVSIGMMISMLATLMIFPLVYGYGLNPAQGPDLVFNVLPIAFAEMPGGRLIGTLFFLLLLFSALTPTLAALEPLVAWLRPHRINFITGAFVQDLGFAASPDRITVDRLD